MATRVHRKKSSDKDRNNGKSSELPPLRPLPTPEEEAEQNKRFMTMLGVTALVVVMLFIVLQFI